MARQIALLIVIGILAYACFWMAWRWFIREAIENELVGREKEKDAD